jgi:hypothetical protein
MTLVEEPVRRTARERSDREAGQAFEEHASRRMRARPGGLTNSLRIDRPPAHHAENCSARA